MCIAENVDDQMLAKLEEYSEGIDCNEHIERLDIFTTINKVEDNDKVNIFFAVIDRKKYSVLKTMVNGDNPSNYYLEDIKKILGKYLSPQPLIIFERYFFMILKQDGDESLKDFALRLQKSSEKCKFGQFLDDALRDKFILGLYDPFRNIQPPVLVENCLKFSSAVEKACQIELASKESVKMEIKDVKATKIRLPEVHTKNM